MSKIAIRQVVLKQLPEVSELFHQYRIFYGARCIYQESEAFIQQRIENQDSYIYLARLKSQAAGFIQLYPSFSSVSAAPIWILNDLFVAEKYRKKGIGQALMQQAREHCIEKKGIRLELTTQKTNLAAKRLYERSGYEMDEVFDKYLLPIKKHTKKEDLFKD